jgi:pimeloyl-ACP methyl ester carboxylesterase
VALERGESMGRDAPRSFTFPVGYEAFHREQLFNFQLNRPYSLGYARLQDLAEAGSRIGSFAAWKTEMLRQADRAVSEGRVMNGAFYVRAAEFYTFPDDPDKAPLYERFLELFEEAFSGHEVQRHGIPYGEAALPALEVIPEGSVRGTIVLHGGYDSFIEEFYSMMRYFSGRGYRVIGFDGPGQGGARRRGGLPLDFRWERPVGAVLDYLGLENVTLVGLSMGGYFALRAASAEERVKRVIASGHAYDYMRVTRAAAAWLLVFFHDHLRDFTNKMSWWKIKQGGMEAWNISHLMYVLGVGEPMAGLDFAMQLSEENLRSDRVTQDVLLLASRNDHFIPFRLHREQLRRLPLARSMTDRVFTRADHAQNHCQIGNLGLAVQVMCDWIDEKCRPTA